MDKIVSRFTSQEIMQQPSVWRSINIPRLKDTEVDIGLGPTILTGAGTSAYIGQILAPYLRARLGVQIEAVSSTDLVSVPMQRLVPEAHGLLVSYARSGDSPESLAACEVFNQLIQSPRHILIQCNPQGLLAQATKDWQRTKSVTMPAPALDRGFAMTSSFTSMLLASLKLFAPDPVQEEGAIRAAEAMLERASPVIAQLMNRRFSRVVFLGSGCLEGLAREAALKILELSAGNIVAISESILGFRHGPKSIINKETIVIVMNSSDHLLGRYEGDIVNEIEIDQISSAVINLDKIDGVDVGKLDDAWRSLVYIIFCQILAFQISLALGLNPDQPFPDGTVNRVVKGVQIYPSSWVL